VHGFVRPARISKKIFLSLVAHNHYERVPNYSQLERRRKVALRERGMNRVTTRASGKEEACAASTASAEALAEGDKESSGTPVNSCTS